MMRPREEIYGDWNSWLHITKHGVRLMPRFHWFQAEKDGGPVLKQQAHWTKINGFSLKLGPYTFDVVFRRRAKS